MSYKEKYNKLVEAIKVLQETNPSDEGLQNWVNDNVPELKESEAERIREELIGFLRNIPNSNYTCEEMALWLEKQGEQPCYNIGDVICDKSCTTINKEAQPNMEIVDIKNGMYICDKGSFPVSQQDEYELVSKKMDSKLNDNSVSNELREASFAHAEKEIKNPTFPDNEEFELIYAFEEGAKWDAAQKSSWSKEDEYCRHQLIVFCENCMVSDSGAKRCAHWLKSLKDRHTWKPSDEQMDALDGICSYIRNKADWEISQDMVSDLYKVSEQLKKLK